MRVLVDWWQRFVIARCSTLTDQVRGLDGVPRDHAGWLCIVGREHYSEQRKSYPRVSDDELVRIIQLEQREQPSDRVFWTLGADTEQSRNVVFYRLLDGVSLPPNAVLHAPESLLATSLLAEGQLGIILRAGHEFFFAAGFPGALKAGFLQTPERYGLAVGREFHGDPLVIEQGLNGLQVLAALRHQPQRVWATFLNLGLVERAARSSAATVSGFVAIGVLYLLLSSLYLVTHARLVENRLAEVGPKVTQLGVKQRELARLQQDVSEISGMLAAREPTYQHWRFVKLLIDQDASVSHLQFFETRLTVRGLAPSATTALGAVARAPGVSGARFSSPVRQAGEKEEFMIEISLAPVGQGRRP